MDLILLRAFVTVAREGNLTRAAKRLNLSQPAVSLQLQNLQQALRLTLFSRTARGLKLTRDGMAMLPHAQRAIETAEAVTRHARALRNEIRGTLAIGTILDPPFLRLGGFLKSLVEGYPQIETALRHGMSGWVKDQIRTGRLAVGYHIDAIDQLPDHELGFEASDKQYFQQTRQYVEIPDFLLNRRFLSSVSRWETLDRAKAFLSGAKRFRGNDEACGEHPAGNWNAGDCRSRRTR